MYPRQEDALPQNCPQRLVRSWSFEAFFAVTNTILLGVQTAWMAEHFASGLPVIFVVLQVIYTVIFTVEVVLRLWADGFHGFACAPHWPWNMPLSENH
ncbi:truA [Symbiodinium pilosum]|uniref:TruA protein n=1 Tax=Symbiodinium pilosum TaxID=2952 RepID=A0A812IZQ3_SYMPI|nr:truA [Symbiodinium pilosum]